MEKPTEIKTMQELAKYFRKGETKVELVSWVDKNGDPIPYDWKKRFFTFEFTIDDVHFWKGFHPYKKIYTGLPTHDYAVHIEGLTFEEGEHGKGSVATFKYHL